LNRLNYYDGKYTDSVYLSGNFSKGYDFFKKQEGTNYNLIAKNCMEVSAAALLLGRINNSSDERKYKYRLRRALPYVIPNEAFEIVKGK
jgi:hypothetical protein